jgi:hypothetical protein
VTQGTVVNIPLRDEGTGLILATVRHDIHGGLLHNVAIFIVEYICVEKKFKLLDCDAWRHKTIAPSVPDVAYERTYKIKRDGKTYPEKELCVVEIDTNGSKTSEKKKWTQFVKENKGWELVYINLKDFTDAEWRLRDELVSSEYLNRLYDFINARMPG